MEDKIADSDDEFKNTILINKMINDKTVSLDGCMKKLKEMVKIDRWDRIEGIIYDNPYVPSAPHSAIVANLDREFRACFKDKKYSVFSWPYTVWFSEIKLRLS